MTHNADHPPPPRYGTAPVAVLTTLLVVGLTLWWLQRTTAHRAMDRSLEAWATAPLPTTDAPVDSALADLGAEIFREKCAACHVVYGPSGLGPDLADATHRRAPQWLQAMILAPDSMTRTDPVAQALKARYQVQMAVPGGIDTLRTRAVIEFLRRVDGPRPAG